MDGTDADVVDVQLGGGIDLFWAMGGQADEPFGADDRSCRAHRQIVLADVNPVCASRFDEVRAIVEDQRHAVLRAGRCIASADRDQPLVAGRLDPQLNQVDATGEGGAKELVRKFVADEV